MSEKLAIDGGPPVRSEPIPARFLMGEEEKAAAIKVMDQALSSGEGYGYNGPSEVQYEKDFVEMMGGGFADGVNSGTNAIFVALGALQLDALSEVIVPPFTDPGGCMPVLFVGCVPVVADADPRTYNTSAEQIEPMITERTRAIVVAHIAGDPVDMDPIMELAKARGLYVIEDCAQAHGAKYKGRLVGTFGHLSAFSTMSGKHHCTGGQGGVVYTQDENLYWQARRFADRGKPFNIPNPCGNVSAGLNCNLNDLAAAIGSVQLKKLPGNLKKRQKIAQAIRDGIKDRKSVSFCWEHPQAESAHWFLKIRFDPSAVTVGKFPFCDALCAEGIPANAAYCAVPSMFPWLKNKAVFGKSGFPWNCSDYKGPKEPVFKIDNAKKAIEDHFNFHIHENYGPKEIEDTLTAIEKVEKAYLK